MKRNLRFFFSIMIAFLFITGTVACSKASEKEKDMTQKEIDTLKEEIKKEIKEEMQAETPAQNTEQETTVQEQPNSVENVPSVTEQPTAEQPVQTDKTEHSGMPINDNKTKDTNEGYKENEENFPKKWGNQHPVQDE